MPGTHHEILALTEELGAPIDIARIARAFNATYQAIGADLQQVDAESARQGYSNRPNHGCIARRDLFEACFDYAYMYGGLAKDEWSLVSKWIMGLPRGGDVENKLIAAIFPSELYE
jgi:hypothetical protein